jgi:hypothetical protein
MIEDLVPLSPISFFALSLSCNEYKNSSLTKKHLLADLSPLHGSRAFAKVSMGWSDKGIRVCVEQKRTEFVTSFPDFFKGDAIELFFDTRDVKTTGYNTKFCHHFYFLPNSTEQEENKGGEITRFRGEETRPLCDPHLLEVFSTFQKGASSIHIFIPKEALFGYDPHQFRRIGFTYRIRHHDGRVQDFSCNSLEVATEQQPSLWASLELVE